MNDLFTLASGELSIVQYVRRLLPKIAAAKNLGKALEASDTVFSVQYERKNIVPAIQKTLKKLTAEKNDQRLIAYIKKLSPETILALAQQDEEFADFCKCEKLKKHWEKLIFELSAPTNPQNPNFRWRAENSSNPLFDQWRGIICLLKYLELNLDQPYLGKRYCKAAAQFGCFYAQYIEIVGLLSALRADLRDDSSKNNVIAKALRTVELHGMPGWVLLATTFMSFAIFYKNQFSQTHNLGDRSISEEYCRYAAMSLDRARALEKTEESRLSLHNAGVGYPFFMSFKIRCRNQEEYSSLGNMEETLAKIDDYSEIDAATRSRTAFFLESSRNRWLNFELSSNPRPA